MQERKPVVIQPVIVTTPTSNLTSAGLAESIACDARWPTPIRNMGSKIPELQVDHLLRQSGTRMLFLVRASLLANGRSGIAAESIPFLLNVLDRGAVTFVLAGGSDLPDLLKRCPDLDGRFFQRMPLEPFVMDDHWYTMINTLSGILGFKNWDSYMDQNGQRLSPFDQDLTEAELAHRDRFQMDVLEREGYGEIANEFLDRGDPTGSWRNAFPQREGFHLLRRQPRLRIAHQRSPSRQSIQHDGEEGDPTSAREIRPAHRRLRLATPKSGCVRAAAATFTNPFHVSAALERKAARKDLSRQE